MSNFDIFDEFEEHFEHFEHFEKSENEKDEQKNEKDHNNEKNEKNEKNVKGDHINVVNEMGVISCSDCGIELKKVMTYEKDWRYYGSDDTRKNSDPNRCHIRKIEDKSIFKDVENLGFSEKIVNTANDIYSQVTKGKIYRGNSRKAIIFGCIFQSIKMIGNVGLNGKVYTCENLRELFGLDRKIILKGLKHVNLNAPKESHIRTKNDNMQDMIDEFIKKFDLSDVQKTEIYEMYQSIKNKSTIINRSRPQSVIASLFYYYIGVKRGFNNVNMNDFVKTVNLSKLTIDKISKEIQSILSESNK
jgi:transcription initiation factor TFIIIB Brf1 subunit/transcription initiation factor TFIIB